MLLAKIKKELAVSLTLFRHNIGLLENPCWIKVKYINTLFKSMIFRKKWLKALRFFTISFWLYPKSTMENSKERTNQTWQ